MCIMSGEYIVLPCNVTSCSDNTIGEYKTHLSSPKDLKGKWLVGLAKISFTKSWYNVRKDAELFIFDSRGLAYISPIKIKAGCYEQESQIVDVISSAVDSTLRMFVASIDDIRKKPALIFNKNSRRASLVSGKLTDGRDLYLDIGKELESMFGLSNDSSIYHIEDVGPLVVDIKQKEIKGIEDPFGTYDLNAGIHSLFVYCNIVEPIAVGDTSAQLLATVGVPSRINFGQQCEERYERPFYIPLLTNSFQTIEISIRDDSAQIVPFKFGRVIVTLHLKEDVSE